MLSDLSVFQIPYIFSYSLCLISTLTVGLFLFFGAYRKDPSARAFANLSFLMTAWEFCALTSVLVPDNFILPGNKLALVLFYFLGISLTLVPLSFLDFVESFSKKYSSISHERARKFWYISGFFIISLFISDLLFGSQFIYKGLAPWPGWFQNWAVIGPFFYIFNLHFNVAFFFGFLWLWRLKRTVDKTVQAQINWIFWTSTIATLGGTSVWPIWYLIPLPPVGIFLIPLYVFGLFYTITRFHLFNLKVVVAQLSIIFIWMIMLSRMIIAHNPETLPLDLGVFAVMVVLGVITIKSAINEAAQKERFADLNLHLEEKVKEQTQEIRKAYEVEKKARIELEELDKSKDQFILNTQHHLRTPLTVMKGFLEAALERKGEVSETVRGYLEKSSAASEQMISLINDFLNVSSFEVGKAILNPQPTDLSLLIEDIYQELKSTIDLKHLSFTSEFSPEALSARAIVDTRVMKAALYNLFDNAVKYTSSGGIAVHSDIFVHPIESVRFLRIKIQDSGIGIDKDDIPKIFNRYFERSAEAQKVNATGKGLGLALSRNMIVLHGGKIDVTSEGKGKGTTFIVDLPIV